jgi:hypothetical protein
VYNLLCRIHPYFGCRRLKQSSEATKAEFSCEVNTSGKLTLPRSTPLGSAPRSRIPHQSTRSQPRSSSQLSSAMWGPPTPIPTSQRPKPGLTHSGEREKHKRSVASHVRDRKTVHNQWTQTIAIVLTLCRGCTIVPARIGPEPAVTDSKPYHTVEGQVSG